MGLPFLEGFVGSNLKTSLSSQVVTKKTHQNENPFKVCEVFQLTRQVSNPGDALANFTYGNLHLKLKLLPQIYRSVSVRTPKNISKDFVVFLILQEFLNIVFIYEIFDSFNAELSNYGVNIP